MDHVIVNLHHNSCPIIIAIRLSTHELNLKSQDLTRPASIIVAVIIIVTIV